MTTPRDIPKAYRYGGHIFEVEFDEANEQAVIRFASYPGAVGYLTAHLPHNPVYYWGYVEYGAGDGYLNACANQSNYIAVVEQVCQHLLDLHQATDHLPPASNDAAVNAIRTWVESLPTIADPEYQ